MTVQRIRQGEFCWVDLMAADLGSQTVFYQSLLGWTHEDIPTDVGPIYRMFYSDGLRVAGASQMSAEMRAGGVPTTWNTYLAADDVDSLARRAEDLGGVIAMPAMDVMREGRMVGIQDPTGATFFLWKPLGHNGAEKFFEPGSLIWNDLNTRDPARATIFYEALLGWEVKRGETSSMPYWQVSVRGTPEGGIIPMPEQIPEQVPAHWLVYFGVTDARASADKAVSLGARADVDPTEIPGMTVFSVLTDPAGATFAIMQSVARQPQD